MKHGTFRCDTEGCEQAFYLDFEDEVGLPPFGQPFPCPHCGGTGSRRLDCPGYSRVTATAVEAAAHNKRAIIERHKAKARQDEPYMGRVRQKMRESNRRKLLAGKDTTTRFAGSISVADWNAKIAQHGPDFWTKNGRAAVKSVGGLVDD